MYLSIGNDMAVRDRSIIGIFDMDNTSTSKRTRAFLAEAERNGEVVPCDDLPKSFVLTAEYGLDLSDLLKCRNAGKATEIIVRYKKNRPVNIHRSVFCCGKNKREVTVENYSFHWLRADVFYSKTVKNRVF